MKKYIEFDALKKWLLTEMASLDGEEDRRFVVERLRKEIPAADVREVVTCGECEFWNRERISCEGLARCLTGESGVRYRNRRDFCSRGKKREET